VRGVCEIYDYHMKRGVEDSKNPKVKQYRDYRKMLEDPDIDAVIVAVPDHWHARMTIDACEAGKDVYCEKGLCKTLDEAKAMVRAVKLNDRVFQLGHQGRASAANYKARELIDSGMLGKITLVRCNHFRNTVEPQWRWYSSYSNFELPKNATPETIDWKRFLGSAPWQPFNIRRYFHWRCYWDYGTGVAGDLQSHGMDEINTVMQMGIPHSAMASGGVYYWKDDRETPDTYNVIFDYPDRDLSIVYQANFQSTTFSRDGTQYFGKEASMRISRGIEVYAESPSQKHAAAVEKAQKEARAAKQPYEAPVIYKSSRADLPRMNGHMDDFLDCVRTRQAPRCNVDVAYEEAVTIVMGIKSLQEERKVFWDPATEEIV
jgi:predicted dehydrogenase